MGIGSTLLDWHLAGRWIAVARVMQCTSPVSEGMVPLCIEVIILLLVNFAVMPYKCITQ
jgi:hypothetical protein